MNHRLRRRHRYLVAAIAAGVLVGALLAARRPLPDPRVDALPAALAAPLPPSPSGAPAAAAAPAQSSSPAPAPSRP